MDTRRIFHAGERGHHLLFDHDTIEQAFSQDSDFLQAYVIRRMPEIESALMELLSLPNAWQGRDFIQRLPREVQHVLVLLYFEILEGRVRRQHRTLH